MGIGEGKLIDSSGIDGGDIWSTAALLAAAIQAEGGIDLVLSGKQSVDENSSGVFVGVAQKLGYPLLSNVVNVVDINDGHITVERVVDGVQETVQAPLPAVVSVGKEINDPRYPSFMGIRKASRTEIPSIDAGDLGVGDLSGQTMWTNIRKPEEEKSEVQIIDGATDQEKASKLADALIAAKII
jgi:electron transfer flavoprotein beta subunit